MGVLRVAIAEDSMLVREGVRQVIERQPDLSVVAAAEDLDGLRSELEERPDDAPVDVVVTDVRMPPTFTDEGIRLAVELRHSHPAVGVVVLSQYAEAAYARDLLADGSAGRAYLLKERVSEPDELASAIRAVAQQRSVVDPRIVELLVNPPSDRSPLATLTPREREVLDHVAQGKSNAGVAAALFLTERSVEKHINAVFSKLGLEMAPDTNRRVSAVLLHLAEHRGG
ncbi:MAG TPA: response regulator transcription factor [Nocardioides sp.]|nr:response regulator transcription factor [Nocardioides sp.]